jgi:hypothetical protein
MFVSQCLFCSHDNPQGAKFCNDCGSPLHLRPCWECNAINDAASETCYKCGAAYSDTPALIAADAPHAGAPVLFAGDAPLPAEAATPAPDEGVAPAEPTLAEGGRAAPGLRPRRRLAVALSAVFLLGAVAIGSYYAYRNPGQVRKWLSTAKAMVMPQRDVAAAPYHSSRDAAPASAANPAAEEAPSAAPSASTKPAATDPNVADAPARPLPADSESASAPRAAVTDSPPGQDTTSGSHSSTPDDAAAVADDKPAITAKAHAKKPRRASGRQPSPSQATSF